VLLGVQTQDFLPPIYPGKSKRIGFNNAGEIYGRLCSPAEGATYRFKGVITKFKLWVAEVTDPNNKIGIFRLESSFENANEIQEDVDRNSDTSPSQIGNKIYYLDAPGISMQIQLGDDPPIDAGAMFFAKRSVFSSRVTFRTEIYRNIGAGPEVKIGHINWHSITTVRRERKSTPSLVADFEQKGRNEILEGGDPQFVEMSLEEARKIVNEGLPQEEQITITQ
jgi:hypothetical protein